MRDRRETRDGRELRVLHVRLSLVPLVSRLAHDIHRRIGFVRKPIEDRLKLQASRLQRGVIGFTRDPDRTAVEEQAPGKWIWDHVAIPTREEFFFEQAKASGMMGRPVALAR
jgi:hypothetical protein